MRSTIQNISDDERRSTEVLQAIRDLDLAIVDKLKHQNDVTFIPPELDEDDDYLPYDPVEPEAEQIEVDTYTPKTFDNLISAEVLLLKGDTLVPAKVISRKRDQEGNPIGTMNPNPVLDKQLNNINLRPPTTKINTTSNTDNTLFIHWRHHPNDISKKTIRTIYNNTLQGKDTFNHMRIVTSRPKNLRDMLCHTNLPTISNNNVSDILSKLNRETNT